MTQDKNIFIHNIYYMLSYAFQSLRQDGYRNVSVESFDEIYDLFAMILSKGIATQLKQGLYREYIDRKDDLKVLRGKIDIQQSMRNASIHRQVLTCEYDELSENVLLNQIIKSTATLLLRSDKVKREYKQSLKKELLYFSNVDLIDPKQVRWSNVRFHRNNQTYYMLIHICRLIIDGMLMTTESGEYKLATFINEQHMCRLYEKFILEYYRKHYPKLNVSASQIPWAVDDDFTKMLPVMQTDIHLQKENDVLIHQKELRIQNDVKDETMYIGKTALNIILSNLISNAINYTHEKGMIQIGIEQGYFFIQNKQDSTQPKGNGLGLYIVRNLLDNYKMKYETIEGEKFIFKIKLK